MRLISEQEKKTVVGGVQSVGSVTVIGHRGNKWTVVNDPIQIHMIMDELHNAEQFQAMDISNVGGGGFTAPDATEITIVVHFERDLTPVEQQAVVKLGQIVELIRANSQNLPDNAVLDLFGQKVTGAEIKALFSKADFEVFDAKDFSTDVYGVHNLRGTVGWDATTGPVLSVDIGYLVELNTGGDQTTIDGSFIGYVMHEISHVTSIGRANNAAMYSPNSPGGVTVTMQEFKDNERLPNDISRAWANYVGLPFSKNAEDYSPQIPAFVVPTPSNTSGGSTGGTGTLGGPRNGGGGPIQYEP